MTDEPVKPRRKPGPRWTSLPTEQLEEIVARLRARTTTLLAESKKLGFYGNDPLRKALRAFLGDEQYAGLDLRRGGWVVDDDAEVVDDDAEREGD